MKSNSSSVSVEPVSPPISGSPAGGRGESAAAPISLSLYQVERELQELLYAREQAEEEGALPAEIEAIDKAIQEYFAREVRKVDGICHALHAFDVAASSAAAEASRLLERAENLRAQHARIKAATLRAMQDHGIRVLETPTNRLRVQANGGKEPLEIESPNAVPDELKTFILKMNYAEWGRLIEFVRGRNVTVRDEIDTEAIRAALKQQVKCPECEGAGHWENTTTDIDDPPEPQTCPRCEGRGTIPNTVPGAKLLPRGFHLRVE